MYYLKSTMGPKITAHKWRKCWSDWQCRIGPGSVDDNVELGSNMGATASTLANGTSGRAVSRVATTGMSFIFCSFFDFFLSPIFNDIVEKGDFVCTFFRVQYFSLLVF